jgi:hypothetical protein
LRVYVWNTYNGLAEGMQRQEVERRLGAFRSYPNPIYGGLGPGQFVIRYELRVIEEAGLSTTIQIIYNPDGTADNVQPVFAY